MVIFDRISKSASYRIRGFKLKSLQKDADRIRRQAENSLRKTTLELSNDIRFTIACLVGKKYLTDLLFTLLSFEKSVGHIGHLSVLSDGTLTAEDADFLTSWHGNCNVFLNPYSLCEHYDYNPPSLLLNFFNSGYFGAAKFLLLNAVQSRANCLLLDSDVIFFQNPLAEKSQLRAHILEGKCLSLEDDLESFDPTIVNYGKQHGKYISKRVNVGLVYIPKATFNSTDWSELIPQISVKEPHIFAEQSAVAAGLESVGFSFLDKSQYVVSSRGAVFPHPESGYVPFVDIEEPYESLVCRHFITPVRHLMWLKAFPMFWDRFF